MKLISCNSCGVLLDHDKLKFAEDIYTEDGPIDMSTLPETPVDARKALVTRLQELSEELSLEYYTESIAEAISMIEADRRQAPAEHQTLIKELRATAQIWEGYVGDMLTKAANMLEAAGKTGERNDN